MCVPRTSSIRIAGASAAPFVLPRSIRRWAGGGDKRAPRLSEGTGRRQGCARLVNGRR